MTKRRRQRRIAAGRVAFDHPTFGGRASCDRAGLRPHLVGPRVSGALPSDRSLLASLPLRLLSLWKAFVELFISCEVPE